MRIFDGFLENCHWKTRLLDFKIGISVNILSQILKSFDGSGFEPIQDFFFRKGDKMLKATYLYILLSEFVFYALIISYSKCSNWHRILKLLSNFGCLFWFCYLDRVTSIKIAYWSCNHVNDWMVLSKLQVCSNLQYRNCNN